MKLKLSTGETTITRLTLFELDKLTPPNIGLFTYEVEVMGKVYDHEFDYNAFETPPEKPEGEVIKDSQEWYDLNDYNLYHAALLHEKRRQEATEKYYENVAKYILENCIEDPSLIVTEKDWIKLYDSVMIEPLTMDVIAETLHKTYNATFEGIPILDALAGLSKGSGEYNTIRLWESKLMVEMNLREIEYSLIPVDERARMVCTIFLDDMMSYLEMEKSRKESDTKK